MRIGVMLRHLGQHGGGVLVYTRSLLERLVQSQAHEFVLMYRDAQHRTAFGANDRVTTMVRRSRTMFGWDQVAVPAMAREARVDVVFNPKFAVPLRRSVASVFVCHGLDWYVMPSASRWQDRLSHRFLIPRYAHTARRIIAVSETAREHAIRYFGVAPERVVTVSLGVDENFLSQRTDEFRRNVRERYRLPERYFLYCGQIYPPKNFARLICAFARVGPSNGVSLVVAGAHTWKSERDMALIDSLGIRPWVVETGWVDRDVLPAFYDLATALVMPSLYEACPSPILEAMATGCPIVTANRYGTAELAGPAAVLVDPDHVDSIAEGMQRVLGDDAVRAEIVAAGRERVKRFSWDTTARETLAVIEHAAG